MSAELLPCPFCGGSNVVTHGDDKFVGIFCRDCQASGPNHYGRYGWNRRADLANMAQVAALVEECRRLAPVIGEAIEVHHLGDKHGIATANAFRAALAALEPGDG